MLARLMPAQAGGGVQDHTRMLAEGLASRGHRVVVVATGRDDGREVEESRGVTIHYLRGTRQGKLEAAWWRESINHVARLHSERPFTLIHSQGPAGYGAIREAHRLEIPGVISFHGTHYDELMTRWRSLRHGYRMSKNLAAILIITGKILFWDLRSIPKARAVIATSNEQAEILRRYFVPQSKIFKVFNGMDLAPFAMETPSGELRKKLGIGRESRVLLCVARLIRDKGVHNAISAMPGVVEKFPGTILLIIGDGSYRPNLEKQVKEMGLGRTVAFVGAVDFGELPAYFSLCDIFLNPTEQQNGYDLTMVEAMASGRPVISSDIGSTPTLIEHGVDGILFPAGDVSRLSREIASLLGDEPRRRALASAARQKVAEKFTLDKMIEGTLEVYRQIRPGSD